ncbi:apolipoprotein N-acyltransferase [Ginsengibacter hankyongi]|uniref:Apolipoprotein N-acyltransferase n=1 Tax=Ginsengibacter hankyongi TaxID=2607284 RepID=A0A5J5IEQ9_9BACT|nr:apolipoprotein N-acyltransferase [Ginsengibacter hankyongi]KAA9038488.1 apolipoprotein N-acyltransferase [Ginsengibacter hankyongi]
MQKIITKSWTLAVVSGILTYMAICHINFIVSWICYIPLFVAIYDKKKKEVFKIAIVFGFTFSCLAFFWMIPGAERFTGYNMLYGVGVFLVSAAFYSLFCGTLSWCFSALKKKDSNLPSIIINGILAGSLFCIAEALLMLLSVGLPWFDVHSGNGLAEDLYAVQPASIFGIHVMTFIAVAVNYLIAIIGTKKLWTKLYIPAALVILYLFFGFILYQNFNNNLPENKSFNVAILAENITPDITWDNNTGNFLVQKLLDLNRLAVTMKPDLALWSESAIPWTYKKDDDLVKEVFKITDRARITHIMGINTAYKENEVFNSAYCILPGGNVTGRYDKQYLLSFIERPLNGWLMPFFSSKGYSALNDTTHSKPLLTSFGKAGFLICNEAAIPAAAANQVQNGAQFLLNMSNDGWFNDTYIVKLHFYYARLRAVESRKDLAVNCNNGFSGLIKASGDIDVKEKSAEPFVKMVTIYPNNYITTASSYPEIFIYACALYIAIVCTSTLIKSKIINNDKSLQRNMV